MKSKSLYLPLFLSVCLSITQSLSLFLSLLPVPHHPARPGRPGLARPHPAFFASLLRSSHPSDPPTQYIGCSHAWGIHSIFTIYYYYCYYYNYKTKHNCIGPWILGILGEGDHSTHCSRPADIHQIEVFLLLLHTTLLTLTTAVSLTAFQYFGIFLTEKHSSASSRPLSSLSKFSVYPERKPRRLAA